MTSKIPVLAAVLEPEIYSNRINIDTGAYATGKLTCLMLEGDKRAYLKYNPKPAF
jgi:serine/threonine protein phosphatase 1